MESITISPVRPHALQPMPAACYYSFITASAYTIRHRGLWCLVSERLPFTIMGSIPTLTKEVATFITMIIIFLPVKQLPKSFRNVRNEDHSSMILPPIFMTK